MLAPEHWMLKADDNSPFQPLDDNPAGAD